MAMTFRTTGRFPTEFDETTNSVLATVQLLGTTDADLHQDQLFLVDMMLMIGSSDPNISMDQTTRIMDLAFIGLVYHRHMPFINEDTMEKVVLSERDPAGYGMTLTMLGNALVEQQGVEPDDIVNCAMDASMEALRHLRRPETLDQEGTRLHTDFITMCILGMVVHRLVPNTDQQP